MTSKIRKWTITFARLAIAAAGLWWVLSHTPWHDRAILAKGQTIQGLTLLQDVEVVILPSPATQLVPPGLLHVSFGRQKVLMEVQTPAGPQRIADFVSLDTPAHASNTLDVPTTQFVRMDRSEQPKIQIGLRNLVRRSNPWLLAASLAVLVIPYVVSAWRWQKLMEPQGIFLPYAKCVALCFVGQFYSTFLPGITSGDLLRIVYTSRVTGRKMESTVTVLLDRAIALLALMVVAGIAAAVQLRTSPMMGRVLLFVGGSLGIGAVASVLYFSGRLRRATGLTWVLSHQAVPEVVRHADGVLHAYRGAWPALAKAFAAALLAQVTFPLSAWMAGMAFGMEAARLGDYLAYVPLAILSACLPISFLGLGVMDSVLFSFFYLKHLADASQTFALAQAIRFFPVVWNCVGAWWVVSGTYSRHQLREDNSPTPTPQEIGQAVSW